MNKQQKEELYIERAKKLKDALPKPRMVTRIRIEDVMRILGVSSKSVARYYLCEMNKLGLVHTEKRGSGTEYFFLENTDADTSAESTA